MTDDAAAADTAVIQTADEFAREMAVTEAKRDAELRHRQASDRHGLALARVWAYFLAVVVIGLFALIGFVVHQLSTEHARISVEHEKQSGDKVTVWCFADPNSGGRSTSEFSGSRRNVEGICPDSHPAP